MNFLTIWQCLKSNKHFSFVLVLTILFVLITGCNFLGLNSDDDEATSTSTGTTGTTTDDGTPGTTTEGVVTKNIPKFNLKNDVENAGPVITKSTTTSKMASTQGVNNTLTTHKFNINGIYNLIREYNDEIHSGVIDGSNMYKAMFEVNKISENIFNRYARSRPDSIQLDSTVFNNSTSVHKSFEIPLQKVASPFDFGEDKMNPTYDYYFESTGDKQPVYAVARFADSVYYLMVGLSSADATDGTKSQQVMQMEKNITKSTIKVNYTYLVDYPAESTDYIVRVYIDGNTQSGLFSIKLKQYNRASSGQSNAISISGYGYSKGDNYYLFRMSSRGHANEIAGNYFVFESETTEKELEAMDDSGFSSVPDSLSDFGGKLPTDYTLDNSDIPDEVSRFTGGGEYGIKLVVSQ